MIESLLERARDYFFDVIIFGVFASALVKYITTKMKYILIQLNINNKLTLAMCANTLKKECEFYIDLGYCEINDRDRITFLYKNYEAAKGNWVIKDLYNKVLLLPIHKEDKNEK